MWCSWRRTDGDCEINSFRTSASSSSMPAQVFTWLQAREDSDPDAIPLIFEFVKAIIEGGLRASFDEASVQSALVSLESSDEWQPIPNLPVAPVIPQLSFTGFASVVRPAAPSVADALDSYPELKGIPLRPAAAERLLLATNSAAQRTELNLKLTLELMTAIQRKQITGATILRPEAVMMLEPFDSETVLMWKEKRIADETQTIEGTRLNEQVKALLQTLLASNALPASVSLPTSFTFYKYPKDEVVMFDINQ